MHLPPKVTNRAFKRLSEINAANEGKALRIAVEGGGCSGFQYEISLSDPTEEDLVIEGGGEKVIIDTASLPFLENAIIDYADEDTPETVEQYAKDVTEFLVWAAEPKLEARKKLGVMTVGYLLILCGLLYWSYREVWSNVDH